MSGIAKIAGKVYLVLNILSSILALSNTYTLRTKFDEHAVIEREFPTKIINHSQIDFE